MNYIANNLSLWVNAYLILNNHMIYFLLLFNTLSHVLENILIWKWTRMLTPFVYWKTFLNISRQIVDCKKDYNQYDVSLNLIGYFRFGVQAVARWFHGEVFVLIRNKKPRKFYSTHTKNSFQETSRKFNPDFPFTS